MSFVSLNLSSFWEQLLRIYKRKNFNGKFVVSYTLHKYVLYNWMNSSKNRLVLITLTWLQLKILSEWTPNTQIDWKYISQSIKKCKRVKHPEKMEMSIHINKHLVNTKNTETWKEQTHLKWRHEVRGPQLEN